MKKIPTLFQRNHEGNRLVRNEVAPGAEWVLAGQGVATRKMDGTCCMVEFGQLFKRREVRDGDTIPLGFRAAGPPDRGKIQGWVPVFANDKWHMEAWELLEDQGRVADGTYELMGPKVQGNPDMLIGHVLIRHGSEVLKDVPRTFAELKSFLWQQTHWEGIVWHRPNGDMVKIKRKDFFTRDEHRVVHVS